MKAYFDNLDAWDRHAALIEADLDGIDPCEMAEHLRAVASLTKRQLSGMLGWAQQQQDGPVYHLAYVLLNEIPPFDPAGCQCSGCKTNPWGSSCTAPPARVPMIGPYSGA